MDFASIINVVKNAQVAVTTAIRYVQDVKETGLTLTTASEEELEAEIKKLEDMLPALRQSTQQKLRGK